MDVNPLLGDGAVEADVVLSNLYPRVLEVERLLLEVRRANERLTAERDHLAAELGAASEAARVAEEHLAALHATWTFRHLSRPRRWYARLRGNPPQST